jgi:hypothetical protein
MDKNTLKEIVELRVCIGFLGESNQESWWPSAFFSPSSEAFLSPVFAKTAFLSQYYGAREAAARIHDRHIGIGKDVFHLFRLPELVEMELHRRLEDPRNIVESRMIVTDSGEARQFLKEYAADSRAEQVGPIRLGSTEMISNRHAWQTAAGCYLGAFQHGTKIFPYFSKTS